MTARATLERKGLIANSRWNLVALLCTLAAQFAILPLVVRWIGLDRFGEASLVIAVWAPFSVIGVVLGQAVTREMAVCLGQADAAGAAQVFDAALLLGLVGSAAAALLVVLLAPMLWSPIHPERAGGEGPRRLFAITSLGWMAQQLAFLCQGVCAARQDFASIARVTAISAAMSVGLTLAATAALGGTQGYLLGVASSFAVTAIVWCVALRGGPDALRWPKQLQRSAVAGLLQFGKWQVASQLAGTLSNQADRYSLAALAPVAVIGQYSAAKRLEEAAYMVVMKMGEVLFPYFGSTAGRPYEERRDFFLCASWVLVGLSVTVLAPVVPLAHSLMALWVGEQAAAGGGLILGVLVLGGVVGCGSNVFMYCAMGVGRADIVARMAWIYSLTTIVLSVALLWAFGPLAAGFGLLLASTFRLGLAIRWAREVLFEGMAWRSLVVSTLLPIAVGVGLAVVLWRSGIGQVDGWVVLVGAYIMLMLLFAASILLAAACSHSGRSIMSKVWVALRLNYAVRGEG